MPSPKGYKPGKHRVNLLLNEELNLDLHAFCELHFDAQQTTILTQGLKLLIEQDLSTPERRKKFDEIRRRLAGEPIRLIREPEAVGSKTGSEK